MVMGGPKYIYTYKILATIIIIIRFACLRRLEIESTKLATKCLFLDDTHASIVHCYAMGIFCIAIKCLNCVEWLWRSTTRRSVTGLWKYIYVPHNWYCRLIRIRRKRTEVNIRSQKGFFPVVSFSLSLPRLRLFILYRMTSVWMG